MQQSEWEIIVLKPTRAFLTFLSSQLPEVNLPDLRSIQSDNTAYVISKQENDEETLNEIERHFAFMFRHEIARWLGEDARNDIEGSFLDFLCCFKFELHSQIFLMEDCFSEGHHLLRIKPRSVLLKWMKSAAEEQQSDLSCVLDKVDLVQLTDNATVIVKNFADSNEIKSFIKEYYQPIFEVEMQRLCEKAELWPDVSSYKAFTQYFNIDVHSQLIHLH